MGIIENIRLNYPLPITKLYTDVHLEIDPRFQFRKLIDLFEGTVRHLTLIGLASYKHHQIIDQNVEGLRPFLEKPSLGHWVNLLKNLAPIVEPYTILLLGSNANQIHKSDAIAEFMPIGAQILGDSIKNKKIKLQHFLDILVECRNKKIGHGNISKSQAKQIVEPLESALLQWLEELSILQQHKLVYITNVEWQAATHFLYRGISLNSGDSPTYFTSEGKDKIHNDRVYLHNSADSSFLSLYPFFIYHDDLRFLYVYHEISKQQQLILRCPYEVTGGDAPYNLDLDKTIVLGSSPIEKVLNITTVVDVDSKKSMSTSPITEAKLETTDEIIVTNRVQTPVETLVEMPGVDDEISRKATIKLKRIFTNDVASEGIKSLTNFETLTQELENRIRHVCLKQARYPILWIVGAPCIGKTLLLGSLCQRVGWKHIDFTLDNGYLDKLIGQEATYRIEDFQETLHSICKSSTEKIVIIDEIEPLLTLWNWDEQEIFFRKISKATRLQCGVVLVTRLRKARELENLVIDKNQVFEIPEGVGL